MFDLISFEGSYFVKECYYTLAVVDLQLWPPLEVKIYSYWKRGELGIKSYFYWCSNSIKMQPFDVKWKVVEYVKDFLLWLENIIGGRVGLLYAEICLKILRLLLNSSSKCSVFDLNQNDLVFFSGRTIFSTFILKNPIPNYQFSGIMLFRDILCGCGHAEEPHQVHRRDEVTYRKSTYQELHHLFFYIYPEFVNFVNLFLTL